MRNVMTRTSKFTDTVQRAAVWCKAVLLFKPK